MAEFDTTKALLHLQTPEGSYVDITDSVVKHQYLTVRMAERHGIVGLLGGLFNIHKWKYEYIIEVHTSDGSVIPFKKYKHINKNKFHEWQRD